MKYFWKSMWRKRDLLRFTGSKLSHQHGPIIPQWWAFCEGEFYDSGSMRWRRMLMPWFSWGGAGGERQTQRHRNRATENEIAGDRTYHLKASSLWLTSLNWIPPFNSPFMCELRVPHPTSSLQDHHLETKPSIFKPVENMLKIYKPK